MASEKLPWFKFFPRDWHADLNLRKCSLAARGLWIELCGYMHQCEPYGHLCDEDGNPFALHEISLMVAAPIADVEAGLKELGKKGVLSRTTDNVIYCRRMVRVHRQSLAQSAKGKKGGNPAMRLKLVDNPDRIKPQLNPEGSGLKPETNGLKPELNPSAITHMPEARVQKDKQLANQSVELTAEAKTQPNGSPWQADPNAKPPPNLPGLERIWAPDDPWGDLARDLVFAIETKSKGTILGANSDCLHDWKADGIDIDLARSVVSEGIKRDGPRSTLKYWDKPVRERDAQRKAAAARPIAIKPAPAALTADQWTIAVKLYFNTGAWSAEGPSPDCTGCRAPADVLASYGYGPQARARR